MAVPRVAPEERSGGRFRVLKGRAHNVLSRFRVLKGRAHNVLKRRESKAQAA
jgi:hypothetical protein